MIFTFTYSEIKFSSEKISATLILLFDSCLSNDLIVDTEIDIYHELLAEAGNFIV